MAQVTNYVLREGKTSAHCPKCKNTDMAILQDRDRRSNGFFICFACHFVKEIGKGAVEKEQA